MRRPLYDPEDEQKDSFDEATLPDYVRELSVDPDSEPELMLPARERLGQPLLPEWERRSDTRKRHESKCQPEEDEEESVGERLEVQTREEVERLKAKAKKESDEEKRRPKEYQDSAKEELKTGLMTPRPDATFLDGCQSEVDRLKAQMRQEVEQLMPELEAERWKVMEVQEEREQLWSLYREEMRLLVKLDYEERLAKLREEHRMELNNVQQKFKNKMSELQRLEEQLQLRAKELKNMEDASLQRRDKLDQITKASDGLRRELQRAAAEAEEAREVLRITRQERDEARTDELLLKMQRDKAVRMCAAAVEERARMKKKYEAMAKRYTREKSQKSSSCLDSGLDRRKIRNTRRRASSSEDSDSSSLSEDTDGSVDHLLAGSRSFKARREGRDKTLDTEQAAHVKNARKDLEETEDEIEKQREAWSNLKQERAHLKEELQDMIEEKAKENMDMALMRTEVLMKERDRVMAQRIREEKEELKKLKRLQKICSLFSRSRRGMEQNEGLRHLFRPERTLEEEAGDTDSSSLSPEPSSAEESCCYVSRRVHSHFPTPEQDGTAVMKMDSPGTAFSP